MLNDLICSNTQGLIDWNIEISFHNKFITKLERIFHFFPGPTQLSIPIILDQELLTIWEKFQVLKLERSFLVIWLNGRIWNPIQTRIYFLATFVRFYLERVENESISRAKLVAGANWNVVRDRNSQCVSELVLLVFFFFFWPRHSLGYLKKNSIGCLIETFSIIQTRLFNRAQKLAVAALK